MGASKSTEEVGQNPKAKREYPVSFRILSSAKTVGLELLPSPVYRTREQGGRRARRDREVAGPCGSCPIPGLRRWRRAVIKGWVRSVRAPSSSEWHHDVSVR